jgi:hypothetical protein
MGLGQDARPGFGYRRPMGEPVANSRHKIIDTLEPILRGGGYDADLIVPEYEFGERRQVAIRSRGMSWRACYVTFLSRRLPRVE